MPALIPVVAAVAAYAGSGAIVAALALEGFAAIAVGVIAGAVIGAAVGAIGAAITGEDIGKNALYGAIGGAVAGGFAGYSTGVSNASGVSSANSISASENAAAGRIANAGSSLSSGGGSGAGSGGFFSSDMAKSALVTTAGTSLSGYYQSKAAEEAADKAAKEAEKRQQADFAQRMKEITANHEGSMAQISAQAGAQLRLADKNNAAAMDQLNTRITADKDTVETANKREDDLRAGFNESVVQTDADLFNRPTFDFNTDEAAFDSGFDEAIASRNLTEEELAAIAAEKERQAAA